MRHVNPRRPVKRTVLKAESKSARRIAAACLIGKSALGVMFAAGLLLAQIAAGQDAAKPAQTKPKAGDEKSIRALIGQLGNDSFDVREAASTRLATFGEPALAQLQKAIKDSPDAEVRERAQQIVQSIAATLFVQVGRFNLPGNNGRPWAGRVAVTGNFPA